MQMCAVALNLTVRVDNRNSLSVTEKRNASFTFARSGAPAFQNVNAVEKEIFPTKMRNMYAIALKRDYSYYGSLHDYYEFPLIIENIHPICDE